MSLEVCTYQAPATGGPSIAIGPAKWRTDVLLRTFTARDARSHARLSSAVVARSLSLMALSLGRAGGCAPARRVRVASRRTAVLVRADRCLIVSPSAQHQHQLLLVTLALVPCSSSTAQQPAALTSCSCSRQRPNEG